MGAEIIDASPRKIRAGAAKMIRIVGGAEICTFRQTGCAARLKITPCAPAEMEFGYRRNSRIPSAPLGPGKPNRPIA